MFSSAAILLTKEGLADFPYDTFEEFRRNWKHGLKKIIFNKTWVIGVIFLVLGWFCFFYSLNGLDLSVSRIIYSMNTVVIFIVTKVILKEKFSKDEFIMLFVVILGTVMIGLSSEQTGIKDSDFSNTLLFFTISYVGAFLCFIPVIPKKGRIGIPIAISSGIFFGLGSLFSRILSIELMNQGLISIDTIFYLTRSIAVWLFLINEVLAFISSQYALKNEKAAIVVSIGNGMANLIPVLGSMIIFQEIISSSSKIIFLRITGILLITIAICYFALVQNRSRPNKTEKSEENLIIN